MEAIIVGSRSISHNRCFQKETETNYKRHVESVKQINSSRTFRLSQMANEVEHLSGFLQKSKSAAKIFRKKQAQEHLKNQNQFLIKKICHLEPIVSTHNPHKFQNISGSNWTHYLKKQTEIKNQNRRIGRKMLLMHLQKQDYRTKLKADIKDYLQLRESIRRMKKSSDTRIKRMLTENKMSFDKKNPQTERKIKKKRQKTNQQDSQQPMKKGHIQQMTST